MRGCYRNIRAVVLGLSRSGIAAVKLLKANGANVIGSDNRELESLDPQVSSLGAQLVLGSHPKEILDEANLIVVSPGVLPQHSILAEARRRSIPIWSEIELGYRHVRGTVIAVTGTMGKSTTATLLRDLILASGRKVRLVGNIGVPLCANVENSTEETVFVIEVSSFQLMHIDKFHPHISVLLDISRDHLDWHQSFSDYVNSKKRLFDNQTENDWAVVFGRNSLTVEMASHCDARKIYFDVNCLDTLLPHLHRDGSVIVQHEHDRTTPVASLESFSLLGQHNQSNALAATAVSTLMGISQEQIEGVFAQFSGLPHTLEKVQEIEGIHFYNDSKATNIQAVKAALASFDSPIVLILGGRLKGDDPRDLCDAVKVGVRQVFAIGENREILKKALSDVVVVEDCESLEVAVKKAYVRSSSGDVVLFSPAGSSFDMYRDYQQRGDDFRRIVGRLEGTSR